MQMKKIMRKRKNLDDFLLNSLGWVEQGSLRTALTCAQVCVLCHPGAAQGFSPEVLELCRPREVPRSCPQHQIPLLDSQLDEDRCVCTGRTIFKPVGNAGGMTPRLLAGTGMGVWALWDILPTASSGISFPIPNLCACDHPCALKLPVRDGRAVLGARYLGELTVGLC